jgi:hypothetical protein
MMLYKLDDLMIRLIVAGPNQVVHARIDHHEFFAA